MKIQAWGLAPWWSAVRWWWKRGRRVTALRVFGRLPAALWFSVRVRGLRGKIVL